MTLAAARLDDLIGALAAAGYAVIGPRLRDGAVVLEPLSNAAELPRGWTTVQTPGGYRVEKRDDAALFAFTHGADSWKKLLHPARVRLWSAARGADGGFAVRENAPLERPLALFGVRGCDLRAIAAQDRVLLHGPYKDAEYAAHRDGAFIVAVDCAEPSGTCFCVSMGSGPAAGPGHDLALTELDPQGATHRFVLRSVTTKGAALLASLALTPAAPDDLKAMRAQNETAATKMGRAMDADAARTLLVERRESAHWRDVAQRCLTCGNCTMVCPTCFCTTVQDTSDLTGDIAERWRLWDSCFTLDFSYVVGGSVRESPAARYRHWITHKLSAWHEQFGESGCVGCGRCITWCPVGIDITAEIAALQAEPAGGVA